MVRWDAINRDRPGAVANKYDRCVKGGQILRRVLRESQDAELLVLATWNDLGEGTGVGRNYDYYVAVRRANNSNVTYRATWDLRLRVCGKVPVGILPRARIDLQLVERLQGKSARKTPCAADRSGACRVDLCKIGRKICRRACRP